MGARDLGPNVEVENISESDIFSHQCRAAFEWASAVDMVFDGVGVKINFREWHQAAALAADLVPSKYGYVYCPVGRDYSTAVAYCIMAGVCKVFVRVFHYR